MVLIRNMVFFVAANAVITISRLSMPVTNTRRQSIQMPRSNVNTALKFSKIKSAKNYIIKQCISLICVTFVKYLSRQNFYYSYIISPFMLIYFVAIAGNFSGTKIVLKITYIKNTNPLKSLFFLAWKVRLKMTVKNKIRERMKDLIAVSATEGFAVKLLLTTIHLPNILKWFLTLSLLEKNARTKRVGKNKQDY